VSETATYVSNATVFNGRAVKARAGVLVSDGRIAWVGSHTRAPRDARAAGEIDARGRTLSPGLIDCHVHLCFDGDPDIVKESRELTPARAAVKTIGNGARHLERGVTTVRDLGGLDFAVCDVAKAIADGLASGPGIVASGCALTITGGHGSGLFAQEVDGPDAVRAAVREQIRGGARSIKVIATGGVLTPGIPVDFTAFTPEELGAAVDEAHKWGRPIAAHAIGRAGIESAVRAGVDSIEHGSQISAEGARLMKERGTFHVPTISAIRGILDNADEVPTYAVEKAEQIAEQARDSFRRAMRSGVRHACGTDAGTPFNAHGNAPLEVVRMVEWGLTPLKALQAATSNAAELLRVEEIGTIEEGKAADIVVWDGNPLDGIDAVLKPALVMKAGEVIAGGSA
jgi:imidazolonepropionase-like amidohydrolase